MIYLASPYSHKDPAVSEGRYLRTARFCAAMARNGHNIVSPVVLWHPTALAHDLPTDFAFWQKICLGLLSRADQLWILCLPGWTQSAGLEAEVHHWKAVMKRTHVDLHYPAED